MRTHAIKGYESSFDLNKFILSANSFKILLPPKSVRISFKYYFPSGRFFTQTYVCLGRDWLLIELRGVDRLGRLRAFAKGPLLCLSLSLGTSSQVPSPLSPAARHLLLSNVQGIIRESAGKRLNKEAPHTEWHMRLVTSL
jgi:hypothetical protein